MALEMDGQIHLNEKLQELSWQEGANDLSMYDYHSINLTLMKTLKSRVIES